jgi:hypothetical protein
VLPGVIHWLGETLVMVVVAQTVTVTVPLSAERPQVPVARAQ